MRQHRHYLRRLQEKQFPQGSTGVSQPSTTEVWGLGILYCGGCPGHCRIFSSIPGFHPLVASSTTFHHDIQKHFLWGTGQITPLTSKGLEQEGEGSIQRRDLGHRGFCRWLTMSPRMHSAKGADKFQLKVLLCTTQVISLWQLTGQVRSYWGVYPGNEFSVFCKGVSLLLKLFSLISSSSYEGWVDART